MDYFQHQGQPLFYTINNFTETYPNYDNNGNVNLWRDPITDGPNNIFYNCSYLIRELCIIIDNRYRINNNCILIFKNLSYSQRKDFYIELTEFGIKFNKSRNLVNNIIVTDIHIPTLNVWSITDYRISTSRVYNFNPTVFNNFYNTLWVGSTILNNGCIIVSMPDYIKFRKILKNAIMAFYDRTIPTTITHNNNKLKYKLSDMIFDNKEKLPDSVYKDFMETIFKISD